MSASQEILTNVKKIHEDMPDQGFVENKMEEIDTTLESMVKSIRTSKDLENDVADIKIDISGLRRELRDIRDILINIKEKLNV